MVWRIPGVGSQYAIIARDANGEWFDGDKTYTVRIPANVPAKNFWSFVVYDPQTRSMLQTPDQKFPSVNSMREDLRTDPDGSVLLTIGPQRPSEGAGNWIQTRPGQGLVRDLAPLRPGLEAVVRQDLAPRRNRTQLARDWGMTGYPS